MNQNFDFANDDAQIISYIQKTIHNTAINYFAKNSRLKDTEFVPGQKTLDYFIEEQAMYPQETVTVVSEKFPLDFSNFALATEFQKLSDKDQSLLIQKYIFGYSDYEISIQLSMTRQGATKKRQRILGKIRKRLLT
ncbi:sigma-70 family RNA polymerase sigma factor [Enterococcus thailandicus]|uniref:sigma-70 family RNA polymerase sigma factor n=1 Tax=Enterococcus thailandicus TaxID=417368 RepID=UPI0025439FF0|nr:sigma-70 family RNA polymerase sigma factor [Enterococcus thailandicus]MDK4352135.1 sigma-70 family RNA polymerase sigma factor [Enterococcus thailandicus]MDT2733098.1 sigma-70 family RNA polymerase sigma factor [Enterococcus thailandicus]